MVEVMCVEGGRKIVVADVASCIHEQQPCILFNGLEEGNVDERDENEVTVAFTPLALLNNKSEDVVVFKKELCDPCVAIVRGEAVIPDGMRRLHSESRVGRSSLQRLDVVLHLELQDTDRNGMDEVED